ncbi:MAG: Hsp33 family molecular chaperone HslO, partial [Pseudolabrys sp.]|nr:Hsp33 family molecular chaperone HslO [Pseudolabrys sp.]
QLSAGMDGPRHNWRAGGIVLQFLPAKPDRMRTADLPPGDAPEGTTPHEIKEDEAWVEGRALIETVSDLELIDPELSSERLLYRLFHERGVRVFREQAVQAKCTCSRESVSNMLASFSHDDRVHMIENGVISVTCEFCNSKYVFQPAEVGAEPDSK